MHFKTLVTAAACCGISSSALCSTITAESSQKLEAALTGSWKGTLEYRDYQSNKRCAAG